MEPYIRDMSHYPVQNCVAESKLTDVRQVEATLELNRQVVRAQTSKCSRHNSLDLDSSYQTDADFPFLGRVICR